MESSVVAFSFLLLCLVCISASPLDLRMIHKFSDEARGLGLVREQWPAKGSIDYFKALHRHDMNRHGRKLLTGNESILVLSQGNYTEDLGPRFGGIHYTLVDIGTPNVSFLVALDTGSDLFWVPCDCKQCESVTEKTLKRKLATFNSSLSTTTKPLTCNDDLCASKGRGCNSSGQICPYTVEYLSENTSTSGKLLEDVIHLLKPSTNSRITAPIVFGCGEVQTGLFLRGGAPNGLLGLGPGDLSLPSLLANDGLIKDTFSMCFDADSSGRLLFGDEGASNQRTTPFLTRNGGQKSYFVSVEGIVIGNRTTASSSSFRALFDTGTTLTYLPAEAYDAATTAFHNQIRLKRLRDASLDPYEFCYRVNGKFSTPSISLIFGGGETFTALDPFLYLFQSDSTEVAGICLGVLKADIPIIGQNFMGGYRLSFDRENSTLGWAQANCYDVEDTTASFGPVPQTAPRFNGSSTQSREDSPFLSPSGQVRGAAAAMRQPSVALRFLLFVPLLLLQIIVHS